MTTQPEQKQTPRAGIAQPKRRRRRHGKSTNQSELRSAFGQVQTLPSGRYRARYTGPDGKRRSGPHTYATRAEAENYLVQVQAEMLRGNTLAVAPTTLTVNDYTQAWLRTAATTLRPRTLELYQRTAARWLLPEVNGIALGPLPLSSLTVTLIREWHTGLVNATRTAALAAKAQPSRARRTHAARAWATATGYPVAATGKLPADVLTAWHAAGSPDPAATTTSADDDPHAGRTAAAQTYRLLRTICAQAVRDGLIATNPVQVKGAATAPHPERIPLSPAEVTRLAESITPRYRAAVLTAAWSGLRPGELFALQRSDIDTTAATITVRRTLVEVTGKPPTYGPPKTNAGKRTVALPASIAAALAEHLAKHTGPQDTALVFTTPTGLPVTATRRAKALKPARATINRPDITWHHLRHTGATLAATAGATQAELQRRIGHSSPRAAALYQHANHTRDTWLAQQLNHLASAPAAPQQPPPGPRDPSPSGVAALRLVRPLEDDRLTG